MESYPRSPEFSSDSDEKKPESDSKDSKKEKKIGGKVAERLIKQSAEAHEQSLEPKNAESIWQRIAALAEKREIDKSILKPVESADNGSKLDAKKTAAPQEDKVAADIEVTADGSAEPTTESEAGAPPDVPLESLSREEARETVQRYARSRKEALHEELREVPEGTPPPAESAADLAFLQFVEEQLAESPDRTVEELLDEAQAATVERIEAGGEENGDGEEPAEEAPEEAVTEGEIPLDGAEGIDTSIIVNPGGSAGALPPASGSGGNSGGGSGGNVSPPHGSGGTGTLPPTSSGGPGGGSAGGGNVPPSYPFPGGMPMPGMVPPSAYYSSSAYAANTSSPNRNTERLITEDEFLTERRRAMAQGFLVGGILGYLIGRRRGRIKTQKRLLPIQKKLEKEVKSLAETVALKEQFIQGQAALTAAKIQTLEQQKRFAESLLPAGAAKEMAARSGRLANAETPARTAEGRSAANLHERQQFSSPRAERLGRIVVEAPVALVAAESLRKDNKENATGINFNKKVEDYTPRELNEAAEKIRVDGVTLRRIRNEHRLDDRAVRRIITKFVEGGSVREALNREFFDKEFRYERDPKHRQGGAAGGVTAAAAVIGMAAGGAASGESSGGGGPANAVNSASSPAADSGSIQKPMPDPQTLARVRRQQIAEVSAAVVGILGIIVALVVLLG